MEDELIDDLARSIGLGETLKAFGDDVRAAARGVVADRAALAAFPAPTAEPWPPMRTPDDER